jgi:hypothetical protein
MKGTIPVVGALVLLVFGGWHGNGPAADPPARGESKGSPDLVAALPDLTTALKESPGCLGVETAQTASGKSVIFAWFEDKEAALSWYNSDAHREAMKRYLPEAKSGRKALADVPDDGGPIMAVASLTPNDKPTKDNPNPFKQIAIELYRPLGEGLAIGGRFAPEKMKLPPHQGEPKKSSPVLTRAAGNYSRPNHRCSRTSVMSSQLE